MNQEKPKCFSIYVNDDNREEIKRIAYKNGMDKLGSSGMRANFNSSTKYSWNGEYWRLRRNYPTLTLDQFREYFGKKPEKWYFDVRGLDKDALDKVNKYKKSHAKSHLSYDINGQPTEVFLNFHPDESFYYTGSINNLKRDYGSLCEDAINITFEQFLEWFYYPEFGRAETRKILGRIAPYNIGRIVRAGDIVVGKGYKHIINPDYYYPKNYIDHGIGSKDSENKIPTELAETWEPVYEEEEKVFYIGDQKKEVRVSKGNVMVGKENIETHQLKFLRTLSENHGKINSWSVQLQDATYKIGCVTGIKLSEIKEIIEAYEQLNK